MSHFAHINPETSEVDQVIVAEQDFIDSGAVGNPAEWVQTSYNTHGGIHYGSDGLPDGGVPLRKNYAGIGCTYDRDRDAFIPPRPDDGAEYILNEETCLWEMPSGDPV